MRRLRYALLAALPVLTLIAARAYLGYCYPGCGIWTSDNPEWYVFFCYLCGYVAPA